jgi:ribosome-binding protein aMBF1 (putative translation factor)
MKCDICGKDIETTFLGKINGNYIKVKGDMHPVCNSCFRSEKADELKKKLGN